MDVFAFLSRDRLDTTTLSCTIFRDVIGHHFVNRCLRNLQEVHIEPYDPGAHLLIAKVVPVRGLVKYAHAGDDIVKFLLRTLKNCYIETFQVEHTHLLPALIPKVSLVSA